MGYYSDYSGSYEPSRPIPAEVAKEINDMGLDLFVYPDDGRFYDCPGEPGEVCPVMCNMKGYNFDADLLKIVKILARHGIELTGEVERVGESSNDYEKIIARDGKVFTAVGEVVYRDEAEVKDYDDEEVIK